MKNRHSPSVLFLSLPHTQNRCTVTMQACLDAQALSPFAAGLAAHGEHEEAFADMGLGSSSDPRWMAGEFKLYA